MLNYRLVMYQRSCTNRRTKGKEFLKPIAYLNTTSVLLFKKQTPGISRVTMVGE